MELWFNSQHNKLTQNQKNIKGTHVSQIKYITKNHKNKLKRNRACAVKNEIINARLWAFELWIVLIDNEPSGLQCEINHKFEKLVNGWRRS